jgi:hypothetical protein
MHVVASVIDSSCSRGAPQAINLGRPQLAVTREPRLQVGKRFGLDPVETTLGVGTYGDQPGLLQHTQVLRDGRLGQSKVRDEVADGPLSVAE